MLDFEKNISEKGTSSPQANTTTVSKSSMVLFGRFANFKKRAPVLLSVLALTISLASLGWSALNTDSALVKPWQQKQPAQVPSNVQLVANKGPAVNGFKTMFGNNPNLVADVAESVAPSVVNIDVAKSQTIRRQFHPFFGDEMFQQFFGFQLDEQGLRQLQQPTKEMKRVIQGNGSGVIIDDAGHILTNNHVIQGADEVQVTLNDGRVFPAKVIGNDRYTDIAVLKIDAPDLKPAALGDSGALRPGEWVLAVGSPLGFDHTVTLGIVSAISRRVPDINMNLDFIQTDAAINPGNSGGPLVNLDGEVIGINTAISGRGQNIGFAIPISMAKSVTENLINDGQVARPWIGVAMTDLTPQLAKSLGYTEATKGVVVAQVLENSPSHKAGFVEGDVVQRVDGAVIDEPKDIQKLVQDKKVGDELNFQILRQGRIMALVVKTEQLPTDYQRQ